jgi:hypothetical protein
MTKIHGHIYEVLGFSLLNTLMSVSLGIGKLQQQSNGYGCLVVKESIRYFFGYYSMTG